MRAAASFLVVSLLLASCLPPVGLFSPNGQIEVSVSIDSEGRPGYAVHYNGASVVDWSRLGIELVDGGPIDGRYRIGDVKRDKHNSTWEQPWGERRIDANGKETHEWHDGQYHVDHLLRNVRAAAQRQVAVNTHEPVKDTGLRRTWPNWLTREGSRGQEFAIWGETPNPPDHTVLLAHTRMLGGPMDFTPGMFNLHPVRDGVHKRIQTTLAKQLALYVVLYSPMQMVPDLPENYAARPDAFQFIVDVPTDWEESIALDGAVGDFVVIARRERGGDDWYLGAITDEQARNVSVPLDVLEQGVHYVAEIYRDGDDADWDDNPYAIAIERKDVTRDTRLELRLAAGGGTAVRFRPQEEATTE